MSQSKLGVLLVFTMLYFLTFDSILQGHPYTTVDFASSVWIYKFLTGVSCVFGFVGRDRSTCVCDTGKYGEIKSESVTNASRRTIVEPAACNCALYFTMQVYAHHNKRSLFLNNI